MVVRFVCVVCVPLCARVFRVSRVCPGSPRCLFTDKPIHTAIFRSRGIFLARLCAYALRRVLS